MMQPPTLGLAPGIGAQVLLPAGLWRASVRHDLAEVRALTGADELLMLELGARVTPAERATALIAVATRRIGAITAPTRDDVRALTVGDRERLLLALYQHSFGGHIDARVCCPDAACGAELDIEAAVADLLTADRGPSDAADLPSALRAKTEIETMADDPLPDGSGPLHEVVLDGDSGPWWVRFRLPNGADQEQAAGIAAADPDAAADLILARCVAGIRTAGGTAVAIESALARLRPPLAAAFQRMDPRAETTLAFDCPDCGTHGRALLDAGYFLLAELKRSDGILVEVDRLARGYHWSEAEILALPLARRRRYLGLLADGAMR